jgi:hypothetical protein
MGLSSAALKNGMMWAFALAIVLGCTVARAGGVQPDNVIVAHATIMSLGQAAWGDPRVPSKMFEDAIPVIVELGSVNALVGSYSPPSASVVLPIAHAPNVGTKIMFIATIKDKQIFQVLSWAGDESLFCLSADYVKQLGLGETVRHSPFAHWSASCGWEIRPPSQVN